MEFKIEGRYPVLRCFLNKGESMVTSAGNMSWMTPHFKYNAKTGGIMKGLARTFTGEKMFRNIYTATEDNQEIAFASSLPGQIKHIKMQGQTLIAQKTAFLASTIGVSFATVFTKKFTAGLLGGEGFILQKFSGHGDLFLEADGSLISYELGANESILVDQGHVYLFDESVRYGVETVKGFKNIFFGGEGLFLVKLTGPGRVVLQTMPISNLAQQIVPFVPSINNK